MRNAGEMKMKTQKIKPIAEKTVESLDREGRDSTHTEESERSPWPTRSSGVIPGDGRTWADVDDWLKARGSSLQELVENMKNGRD
jgi:hypothetical protein